MRFQNDVLHDVIHSTNQKCSQLLFVTKFPNQLCVISCATTNAKERSPALKQQRVTQYSVSPIKIYHTSHQHLYVNTVSS